MKSFSNFFKDLSNIIDKNIKDANKNINKEITKEDLKLISSSSN